MLLLTAKSTACRLTMSSTWRRRWHLIRALLKYSQLCHAELHYWYLMSQWGCSHVSSPCCWLTYIMSLSYRWLRWWCDYIIAVIRIS